MNLNQLCVSLPLARRLKELGVEQKSLFWWVPDQDKEYLLYHNEEVEIHERRLLRPVSARIAAHTAGELLELLPSEYEVFKANRNAELNIEHKPWGCDEVANISNVFFADTPVDAMALMIIHLLEEGRMK